MIQNNDSGIYEGKMNWKDLLCEERIRQFTKSTTGSDLRSEFEKDYHRIIGSAAFRRLQDKTQVFPLDKSDYVRTRLTHSLEVSSFGKSLGQSVGQRIIDKGLDPDFSYRQKEDICNILQCAGLIHDIGNPPFGHYGEGVIQSFFKENMHRLTYDGRALSDVLTKQQQEDFYNFEGNTQALRVVTKLHFLVDEHGMNLTKALLGTIIKYPVASTEVKSIPGDIRCKKMGYFYADKDIFEDVQRSTGTNGSRHPLTYLLEAADDIAYRTADIEDAIKKGKLTVKLLIEELEQRLEPATDGDMKGNKFVDELIRKYDKAVGINHKHPDMYAIQNWSVYVQGRALYAVSESFTDHYDALMSGEYNNDLFAGTEVNDIMKALGDIAYSYVFSSRPIYKLEIAADTIFNFLLDKFVRAAIYYDTDVTLSPLDERLMELISRDYKKIYEIYSRDRSDNTKLYLRLLLVTDYICGMTDSYAKNLYQELIGIQ